MASRVVTGRSTIRFVKDPPPGEKGDSLVSFLVYFKLTETLEPPSTAYLDEAHGWYLTTSASCPRAATAAKPFLWECDVYEFDNVLLNKTVLKLAETMMPDVRPNLLEQTAFEPGYMDKWLTQDGDIKVDVRAGYNAFGNFPKEKRTISGTVFRHRELLLQRVMNNQEGWSKIKGDSWYTLSFWSRTRIYENLTSNAYGFGYRTLILHPGTYRLIFNGHCSADAVTKGNYLGVAVWLQDSEGHWISGKNICTWWDSGAQLTETVDTTKTCSFTLTVEASDEENYTAKIGFYAFKSGYTTGTPLGNVTINWWRLESIGDTDRGLLNTYCYSGTETNPGLSGSTYFVDGVVLEHQQGSDCCANFRLADDVGDSEGWTRHWVSFRTKATVPPALQNILFRMYNNYVEICQPKLEEGLMPTDWCPNENDPTIHYCHQPAGTWTTNTRYYYYNGMRDVVRAITSAAGTSWAWFRLKKRTDTNGYLSTTQPYLDTDHWEQANNLRFIMVEAMFAEDIVTDHLTVSHVKSSPAGKFELKPDGSVTMASGKFTIDTQGNITGQDFMLQGGEFAGAVRAPYFTLRDSDYSEGDYLPVLTHPNMMVIFEGETATSVRNVNFPSPNNMNFNGLEIRIARSVLQPDNGILRINIPAPWSDGLMTIKKNSYDAAAVIDLYPGQELVVRGLVRDLSGAKGVWMIQNGYERIKDVATCLKIYDATDNNKVKFQKLTWNGQFGAPLVPTDW